MLHGIFDLAVLHKSYCTTQYKRKLNLAQHGKNCIVPFNHNTTMNPVTGLYNMLTATPLGLPSHHEGNHGLKTDQASWPLQNYFASCLFVILPVELSHVFTPPLLVWLTQGDIRTCNALREKPLPHQLIQSTLDSCSSKKKGHPLVPFVLK